MISIACERNKNLWSDRLFRPNLPENPELTRLPDYERPYLRDSKRACKSWLYEQPWRLSAYPAPSSHELSDLLVNHGDYLTTRLLSTPAKKPRQKKRPGRERRGKGVGREGRIEALE
jgi:hypothetical protein